MSDEFPRPRTADEAAAAIVGAMTEGVDYGVGETYPAGVPVASCDVRFRGTLRRVWVFTPPGADGFFEDRLNAACRLVFGVARGSARVVQGEPGVLEFRESWTSPAVGQVVERGLKVRVLDETGRQVAEETLNVETAAVAGADVMAVVVAAAHVCCRRKYGPGSLKPAAGTDRTLEFTRGGSELAMGFVPFRFTVHRPGGTAVELVVAVPYSSRGNPQAVEYALASECRRRWGRGRLKYLPDTGTEVHFRYE